MAKNNTTAIRCNVKNDTVEYIIASQNMEVENDYNIINPDAEAFFETIEQSEIVSVTPTAPPTTSLRKRIGLFRTPISKTKEAASVVRLFSGRQQRQPTIAAATDASSATSEMNKIESAVEMVEEITYINTSDNAAQSNALPHLIVDDQSTTGSATANNANQNKRSTAMSACNVTTKKRVYLSFDQVDHNLVIGCGAMVAAILAATIPFVIVIGLLVFAIYSLLLWTLKRFLCLKNNQMQANCDPANCSQSALNTSVLTEASTFYEMAQIEEHRPLKSYAGWMNLVHDYNPATFHISMMQTVFIKVDGVNLSISSDASSGVRVPKRSSWSEQPIDRHRCAFRKIVHHHLGGARIEMSPPGIACKRHFNRKYPILLIIKNNRTSQSTDGSLLRTGDTAVISKSENSFECLENESNSCLLNDNDSDSSGVRSTKGGGKFGAVPQSVASGESKNSSFGYTDKSKANYDDYPCDIFGNLSESTVQQIQQLSTSGDQSERAHETRILLFARSDREKEDWYRRFLAASLFDVHDTCSGSSSGTSTDKKKTFNSQEIEISGTASRCPSNYMVFMLEIVNKFKIAACNRKSESKLHKSNNNETDALPSALEQTPPTPVEHSTLELNNDLLGINVLICRILWSCMTDTIVVQRIKNFMQKKLSVIRLPSCMEDVVITEIHMGDLPPTIERIGDIKLDERGLWLNADINYDGLVHATISTKLNLLLPRHKRPKKIPSAQTMQHTTTAVSNCQENTKLMHGHTQATPADTSLNNKVENDDLQLNEPNSSPSMLVAPIYDSNAESSGESSSESESQPLTSDSGNCAFNGTVQSAQTANSQTVSETSLTLPAQQHQKQQQHQLQSTPSTAQLPVQATSMPVAQSSSAHSRRLFRLVDRITTSQLFQSATEISYIHRAMDNMNTAIRLRVELRSLSSRIVINIPPPPTNRIWIAFRDPPTLQLTTKPAVGDHSVDWTILTDVIESKIREEVNKYLVYPQMLDVILDLLGKSTYQNST